MFSLGYRRDGGPVTAGVVARPLYAHARKFTSIKGHGNISFKKQRNAVVDTYYLIYKLKIGGSQIGEVITVTARS